MAEIITKKCKYHAKTFTNSDDDSSNDNGDDDNAARWDKRRTIRKQSKSCMLMVTTLNDGQRLN
ncbi:uncharacterized protein ZHAS_00020642 [Anopheles sinensis]|uniref:Uncharacterized protein n=1 Tax=Anopheles sinensis TaxID=74873 RepID=A0A084WQB9_ANOSI|nr:uncharacterized protein ZHAS_00020642 [Anopheles sinensis]